MQKKKPLVKTLINDHFRLKDVISKHIKEIQKIANFISSVVNKGGCVFWCGNGGSAADAQHLAAELVGRFEKNRKPIKSIALNTDTSVLTALSNDFGYNIVFERQLQSLATKKDVLIVFSTSGNSKNIINVLKYAKKVKVKSIAILGNKGGKAKKYSSLNVSLPMKNTARIQEMHILIGHIICSIIETNLIKKK